MKRGPFAAVLFASLASFASTLVAGSALAAPPFVERNLTLPRHHWSFDLGLGIAHDDQPNPTLTGVGLNTEVAVAIVEDVELGFRTGFRFGREGQDTHADEYGRLFDRETFGTSNDKVANPEVRLRGQLVKERVVELALEGRVYLPIEQGTRVGMMFGMPLAFHVSRRVRFDTGVYVPVLFYDPTFFAFSAPFHVWFQATPKVWLGPMTGIRVERQGAFVDRFGLPLGFGFGYQLARWADFKLMAMLPHVNQREGARDFGLGVGFQLRIE